MELHFQLQLQNKDNTFDESSKQLINIYYWRRSRAPSCVPVSNSQRRCITLWEPTNQSDPLSHCSCKQDNNKTDLMEASGAVRKQKSRIGFYLCLSLGLLKWFKCGLQLCPGATYVDKKVCCEFLSWLCSFALHYPDINIPIKCFHFFFNVKTSDFVNIKWKWGNRSLVSLRRWRPISVRLLQMPRG